MTKAEQIMSLHDGSRSSRAIAELVGCHDAYVRTVLQRARGPRPSDKAHAAKVSRRYHMLRLLGYVHGEAKKFAARTRTSIAWLK